MKPNAAHLASFIRFIPAYVSPLEGVSRATGGKAITEHLPPFELTTPRQIKSFVVERKDAKL
jgi:hypothetical protein